MNRLLDFLQTGETYQKMELIQRLGMTEEALHAAIRALCAQGYRVAEEGNGVRLAPVPGSLLPGYIRAELTTARMGRGELLYAPEMDSTNNVLKLEAAKRALPEGSLAVCDRQTAGKGRLQRQWADPETGASLPCSLLLTPQLPPERLPLITLAAAVAAADAITDFGLSPGIKWPNDVVLDGRKCVGILCEAVTGAEGAHQVVVGVGFNVNQKSFPGELATKATSLRLASGRITDRRQLLCRYLWHMERAMDLLTQDGFAGLAPHYESRSVTLGRRVEVIGATETFQAVAERVDATGALWVRDDQGEQRRVLSGDVSVRGVMGYV